jgi:hypothetical protein
MNINTQALHEALVSLWRKDIIHGRTGRKKLGGRKQICPTFPDFARLLQKKIFPPVAKKISVSVPF